jgi:type II secretion system protein N
MRTWRRALIIAGYLGYAMALFVLFAYLKFPSQQVRAFVLTTLSRYGLEQVRIGTVQPFFPAGLAFNDVSVEHEVNGHLLELMRMPELQLQLRSLRPFVSPIRIALAGGLYGGSVLGAVEWEPNGGRPTLGMHISLQDIRPGAHPLAAKLGEAAFEGKVAGDITLQLAGAHWQDGNGRLIIQGGAGSISGLEISGIRLPSLSYEQLAGEAALRQRSVAIKVFQIRGRDWQVDLQGTIRLSERLRQSPIDLTLRLRAPEAVEQQLGIVGALLRLGRDRRGFTSLRIGGTLERPNPEL